MKCQNSKRLGEIKEFSVCFQFIIISKMAKQLWKEGISITINYNVGLVFITLKKHFYYLVYVYFCTTTARYINYRKYC